MTVKLCNLYFVVLLLKLNQIYCIIQKSAHSQCKTKESFLIRLHLRDLHQDYFWWEKFITCKEGQMQKFQEPLDSTA